VSKKKSKTPDNRTSEDTLDLLRWAASQGMKKKLNTPTAGTLLGVVPRENSRELRYSWDSVNAHQYLRIQEFQFDVRDTTWHPVRGRCYSVRVNELEKVYGFIKEAIDLAAVKAMDDLQNPFSDLNTDLIKEFDHMDFK